MSVNGSASHVWLGASTSRSTSPLDSSESALLSVTVLADASIDATATW
jgi:hypothetical protein